MDKKIINHIAIDKISAKAAVEHYLMFNLENYLEKQDLKYFFEFQKLYKFEHFEDILKTLSIYGKVVTNSKDMYIPGTNFIIFINIKTQSEYSTGFISFEVYYNDKIDITDFTQKFYSLLEKYESVDILTCVDWFFKFHNYLEKISFYEQNNITIYNEAYPYVTEGIEQYVKSYLESNEVVLLLLGPPGTGKTKLIKYIMKAMAEHKNFKNRISVSNNDVPTSVDYENVFRVSYATSPEVYDDDEFFISFLRNNSKLLVLEDIDYNLRSRLEGNVFMHKLLDTSDGIINPNNKKIVITTNLENERKMDTALLRPGRTFDVLNTRRLEEDEALALCEKLGTKLLPKSKKRYSLAEIYNNKVERNNEI